MPGPSRSEQRADLHQAVGEATTAWTNVEDQLSILFCYFVAGPVQPVSIRPNQVPAQPALLSATMRHVAAKAAFHAVINFNTKLGMTHHAAEWAIPRQLERWKTLHNRLNRQAKRRNDIAHFAMIRSGPFPGGPFKFYLSPSLQNINHHVIGDAPRLSVQDVRQRAESFRALAKELWDFAVDIGAVQPSKDPPQGFVELLAQLDPDNTDTE